MTRQTLAPDNNNLRRNLTILGGVVLLIVLTALLKTFFTERSRAVTESPEIQLERYQAKSIPALVFFHSPDCLSCLQVQKSIDTVYPEFRDRVGLVDVGVLEAQNQDFVERTGVHSTPALIFILPSGDEKLLMGEISPDSLRNELAALTGGTP